MARPFAWGIIGTGGIASQFAADLAHVPDAKLAAVCSRDGVKAEAFARPFGARAYAEAEAICADPALDALYIATPNSLHAEQAILALSHGKPVLVEKPLAISVAEAKRVQAAALTHNCFAMEAIWTRFLPAVQAAKKLLDDGAIGTIASIRAELAFPHPESDSRFYDPKLGGGAALDLGVYPISLALHFLGTPTSVSGSWRKSASGVDVASSFDLRFGAVQAQLSCGFDREGVNQFVIEGSKGALRLEAPFIKAQRLTQFSATAFSRQAISGNAPRGALAKIADRLPMPGRRVQRFPFPGNGLQFEAAAVMEAIRQGKTQTDTMPLTDSVKALEIIGTVLAGPPSAG